MKPELMEKFKELDADVKEAFKLFGEYNYYDKGPEEVMDVDKWDEWVQTLTEEDAITFANYVVEHDYRDHRLEMFIERINDSLPEEWWEKREQGRGEPVEIKVDNLNDVIAEAMKRRNEQGR